MVINLSSKHSILVLSKITKLNPHTFSKIRQPQRMFKGANHKPVINNWFTRGRTFKIWYLIITMRFHLCKKYRTLMSHLQTDSKKGWRIIWKQMFCQKLRAGIMEVIGKEELNKAQLPHLPGLKKKALWIYEPTRFLADKG